MRTNCVPGAADAAGEAATDGFAAALPLAAGFADAGADDAGLADAGVDAAGLVEAGAAEGDAADGAAAWPPHAARSDMPAAPMPSRRK